MAGSVEYIAIVDDDSSNTLDVNADGELAIDISDITRGTEDTSTFSGTITAGSTQTLTVNTSLSDKVSLLIDNGTTGTQPSSYDLTQYVFKDEFSDFMWYDSVSNSTARSWIDPSFGSQFKVDITNIKNQDANYRIHLGSFKEMN